jgi:hypothetical protein
MLQLQFGILPPGSTVKFYGPDPTPANKADGIGPEIPADGVIPDLDRFTEGGVYAAVVSARGYAGCTATAYVTVLKDVTPSCENLIIISSFINRTYVFRTCQFSRLCMVSYFWRCSL